MMGILARLARMDRAELTWRGVAAARIAVARARARVSPPAWDRRHLHAALAPLPAMAPARGALAAGRWDQAQRTLATHFANAPRRFVIAASKRDVLADRLRRDFPQSVHDAAVAGNRILEGRYDVLGYRGLRFATPVDRSGSALPDWQYDPVHDRRAPNAFWSIVPYLDPAIGDHKIIWELNRHQHWLTLGRAYWLTGHRAYRQRVLDELVSWMPTNQPLAGVNWASMLELAFRSLSWVWALQFFADGDDGGAPWMVDLLLGIDRQLSHVEANLSCYFSPNTHLLGEALALYVAGLALPELKASSRRAATGRRVLVTEIARQIAADGGHCERSAHYHRYTLDFYLLALAIARIHHDPAAADFERAAQQLAAAARLLADDNGRLPHVGDDDGGALAPMFGREADDVRGSLAVAAAMLGRRELQIGTTPEDVWWLAPDARAASGENRSAIVSQPSGALAQTGYYVSRSADGTQLVIDAGPHGFQNGGHAHADALSITLTVRGLPLLIDPGTMSYTTDAVLRNRMRSSVMHNTLTVDGRSQSIPRGPFHWAHTANGHTIRWSTERDFDYFEGTHDGYAPIEHRRRVLARHGDLVVVADAVTCAGRHRAAAHWHFDPRWHVDVRGRRVALAAGDQRLMFAIAGGIVESFTGDGPSGLGWYSPVYGRLEPTTTVRVSVEGASPLRIASVFSLDAANPIVAVEWMSEETLRINRVQSTDDIVFTTTDPVFRRTSNAERHPKDRLCVESLAS